MPTQSILNPYWNEFLKEEFSGSNEESTLDYSNTSLPIANSTVNGNVNTFGNLIISSLLNQYNTKYGTNYNSTNFGIVGLNNDQNSQCAYLVFPLLTSIYVLFRVYLEIGNSFEIGFNHIKYIKSPLYSNPVTQAPISDTLQIIRCNILMPPFTLNIFNTNLSAKRSTVSIRNLSTQVIKKSFCPTPYTTPLFDIIPETFILDRYVPYTVNLDIGDGYVTNTPSLFSLGNGLEFLSNYPYINNLIIGNDLSTTASTTNGTIEDFSIGNGVSANSSEATTSFAIGDGLSSSTSTSTTSFTIGSTS